MNFDYNEIFKLICGVISTLSATFIGGFLAYKLNLKLQNKIIKKQVRISELKSLLINMHEYKESLRALQINFVFFHNNESKKDHIKYRLSESNTKAVIFERELFLNEIMFEEYDIDFNNFKEEFNMISDTIDLIIIYGNDKKPEYHEKFIKEKPIQDRIEVLIEKLEEYIKILQKEYVKDL